MRSLHARLGILFGIAAICSIAVLFVVVGRASEPLPAGDVRPVTWMDLMPDAEVAEWEATQSLGPTSEFDWLEDEAALGLTSEDEGPWSPQPQLNLTAQPRDDLDGVRVALSGYMTPLEFGTGETQLFLLVPYVGACIHVPAPPPNQIVLVDSAEPVPILDMWEPFTAVGTLSVQRLDTGLAQSAYVMQLDQMLALEVAGGPEEDYVDSF